MLSAETAAVPFEVMSLPPEILHLVLVQAIVSRSERDFGRAFRLKLVCKSFYRAFEPALFDSHLLSTWQPPAVDDWPIRRSYGVAGLYHAYYASCVARESRLGSWRFGELRGVARRICDETGGDLQSIVDGLCWLALDQHLTDPDLGWPTVKPSRDAASAPRNIGLASDELPRNRAGGVSLLSAAAYFNLLPLARELLRQGCDPTADTKLLPPALQVAAFAGHAAMVRLFQEHLPEATRRPRGPNRLQLNWFGKADATAVVGAALAGDRAMLALALDPPSSSAAPRLPPAAVGDDPGPDGNPDRWPFVRQALTAALGRTADWDTYVAMAGYYDEACPDPAGFFAGRARGLALRHLRMHAAYGNVAMVRGLLDAGVAVGGVVAPGAAALRPLELAARHGHADIVDLLLARGADATRRGATEWAPLVAAAKGGSLHIARALQQHGAIANRIAVVEALLLESTALADFLLEHYAGVPEIDLAGARELMRQRGLASMELYLERKGVLLWTNPHRAPRLTSWVEYTWMDD